MNRMNYGGVWRSALRFAVLVALPLGASGGRMLAQENPHLLVSVEWLAQHKDDADVVVVHLASSRRRLPSEYIPGISAVSPPIKLQPDWRHPAAIPLTTL